jgi:polyisoprenoid-binding protein YceI
MRLAQTTGWPMASAHVAESNSVGLSPSDWRVIEARSAVGFLAHSLFGLIVVRGRYSGIEGWLRIDGAGRARGGLRIDAATVSTRIKKRDAHLCSADFFAVDAYPHMTFELKSLAPIPHGSVTAIGMLRIRDHTVPIITPISMSALGPDGLRIDAGFEVDPRAAGFDTKRLPHTARIRAALVLERAG